MFTSRKNIILLRPDMAAYSHFPSPFLGNRLKEPVFFWSKIERST